MNSKLLQSIEDELNITTTQNGAITYKSTSDAILDFFAQAGSMRNNQSEMIRLFSKAYACDKLSSIRTMFYIRDIRGGQGERLTFRSCLQYLFENDIKVFNSIISYVPEYGRFDDLFFDERFVNNTSVKTLLYNQLRNDLMNDNPSLLAKWLPSINASSVNTRKKAKNIVKSFNINSITYRKMLVNCRKKIKAVEAYMSARKWNEIDYETVPSQASFKYRKAFRKRDAERYISYIESVSKGESKINTSTLYPYQIYDSIGLENDKTLELLWNNLPNYTNNKNALVVADVSGSMIGRPISVSVSLALYFAERNKGLFNNYFLTFSTEPELVKIVGNTLREKIYNVLRANWSMSTNLNKVFELILNTANKNNINADEMPETIYIISDMEFNDCVGVSNFDNIKNKYNEAGYKLPSIVFWNVNASGCNVPVKKNEAGVSLVSGFSTSNFKIAVENLTPLEIMNNIINSDRYNKINI